MRPPQTDLRIQQELMAASPRSRASWRAPAPTNSASIPAGLNETDMFMTLAPRKEWREPRTCDLADGRDAQGARRAFPGISYAFAQPIDMRVQEMIIGARGDVVVKVFGDDIASSTASPREVAHAMQKHPRRNRRVRAAQRRA